MIEKCKSETVELKKKCSVGKLFAVERAKKLKEHSEVAEGRKEQKR
jgi:hypothetical protein